MINQTFPSFLYEQSIVTVNGHILWSLQWRGTTPRWQWWCTATVKCSRCDCPTQRGEQGEAQEQEERQGSLQPEGGGYKHSKWECMLCDSTRARTKRQETRGPGHERFGVIPEVTSYLYHSLLSTSVPRSPTNEPSQIPAAVSNLHTTALVEKEGKSHRAFSWGHMQWQRQQIREPF